MCHYTPRIIYGLKGAVIQEAIIHILSRMKFVEDRETYFILMNLKNIYLSDYAEPSVLGLCPQISYSRGGDVHTLVLLVTLCGLLGFDVSWKDRNMCFEYVLCVLVLHVV